MNYQELNIADVVIRPRHQESLREIERLTLEKEIRDNGIQEGESGRRDRH